MNLLQNRNIVVAVENKLMVSRGYTLLYIKYITNKDLLYSMSFPRSSAGEESVCNAGDQGLIPGLGRSPG